jgi:hypothetical protein
MGAIRANCVLLWAGHAYYCFNYGFQNNKKGTPCVPFLFTGCLTRYHLLPLLL